ncbi:hypothetical protein A2U01_0018216 [Trifolium medium]|uniref:Uncharacterized protein n=1 Tax=Trifolium medium TaxID=97028 RepID=A0A392NCD6_9FABA|nr:hypothetical protein [Trifolium medium]
MIAMLQLVDQLTLLPLRMTTNKEMLTRRQALVGRGESCYSHCRGYCFSLSSLADNDEKMEEGWITIPKERRINQEKL